MSAVVADVPLVGNGQTVTVSTPLLNLTQTWNGSGVTFTGALVNVTDTASASGSILMDFQVAGSSKFTIRKDGIIITPANIIAGNTGTISFNSRASLSSPADGVLKINTNGGSQLTVGTLPSASTAGAGARSFVTDANATTFATIVAAGGSNGVPVYSDGTNWRIG